MAKAGNNGGNGDPKRNGGNGDPWKEWRNPDGSFKAGHPGGPGRPKSHRGEIFNRAGDRACTDEVADEVWRVVISAATGGEPWAVREVFERSMGKSQAHIAISDERDDDGDPFDLLADPEVTGAIDRAIARLSPRPPVG